MNLAELVVLAFLKWKMEMSAIEGLRCLIIVINNSHNSHKKIPFFGGGPSLMQVVQVIKSVKH